MTKVSGKVEEYIEELTKSIEVQLFRLKNQEGWISVEDALPPPDTKCWVVQHIEHDDDRYKSVPHIHTRKYRTTNKRGKPVKDRWGCTHRKGWRFVVTHWIAIPKIPVS